MPEIVVSSNPPSCGKPAAGLPLTHRIYLLITSYPTSHISSQIARPVSCSVSSKQTECARGSGVQAEGRRLSIILHQNLQSKSLQSIYLSSYVFSLKT